MLNIFTNANSLSKKFDVGLRVLDGFLTAALRNLAIKINRKALDNLAGSNKAVPGSYPVPNRTGNLFRGQQWAMSSTGRAAFIFNDRPYAKQIHEGEGSSQKFGRRPFLDDAVDAVDILGGTEQAMRRSFLS